MPVFTGMTNVATRAITGGHGGPPLQGSGWPDGHQLRVVSGGPPLQGFGTCDEIASSFGGNILARTAPVVGRGLQLLNVSVSG